MTTQNVLLFLAGSLLPSFVIALVATYLVRANAARFKLIDLPSDARYIAHRRRGVVDSRCGWE